MEIQISHRNLIFYAGLVQMAFLGLFFYVFDTLLHIPLNLSSAFMAVTCVQLYMDKSVLSRAWHRGFLIIAVLLYVYFLSSPFLNYKELFEFNLGFYLILGTVLYLILFFIFSHFAKKKAAAIQTSEN